MIVWSGLGFLIGIIGIGALIGAQMLSTSITENPNFYNENPWMIFVAMVVAATVTHVLNKSILAPQSKTVIDKETGEEIVLEKKHSLFFIPSKWWPAVFIVLGIIGTVIK